MRTLEELIARDEITDVLYRYCRGVDRMDVDLTKSCWHPDGTARYSDYFEGTVDDLIAWMWPLHDGMATHSHQVTNRTIEVSGDTARTETYVIASLRTLGDAPIDILSRGRYLDRLSRRDGVWAIDHRTFVDDLTAMYSPLLDDGPTVDTVVADAAYTRRDRDDPSYAHLDG